MYMTPEEKIEYVKNSIEEKVAISPKGPVHLKLYTVTHPDNEEWTVLSVGEQKSILKKLKEEGYIKNIVMDDDGRGCWFEKVKKRSPKNVTATRRSNVYSHIKTTDQLLQERELFEKVIKIVGDIKSKHKYTIPTDEANDDLIQLLIDLQLVEYDWKEMDKQKHRAVGNRIIEFSVEADKIIALKNRVSGKGGRVRKDALELIAKDIGERFTLAQIVQMLTDVGVPESMFIHDTKWRAVLYVLSYYTTSDTDITMFLKILERVVHPLAFDGSEEKAKEVQEKYSKYLKYNNILVKDNKAYIGPTSEEYDLGMDDWVSSEGEVVEPKSYVIYPEKVANLWILLGQMVILVSAYQNNKALDQNELEQLYLELIGKVEDLIEGGELGALKEDYIRPFTSLTTAEIEAKAKGAESPLDLLSMLLLKVTVLNPDPTLISKYLKEHTELIGRITKSTRAISGDNQELDIAAMSYEQAVFLVKIIMGHVFRILETVSTGHLNMTDEKLNTQYIIVRDYFDELLERDDLTTIKEKRDAMMALPENLFETLDEMDIWWECGGQSGLMSIVGSIETLWIRSGQQTFPLPVWLVDLLNKTLEITDEHRRVKSGKWDRMMKRIDEDVKNNGGPFNVPKQEEPVQRHEHVHKHTFENSIQEKDIILNVHDNHKKDDKPKRKFPYKIQSGTTWESFYIQFKNAEAVTIKVSGHTYDTSFADMGFADKRTGKPNTQWTLLTVFAKNGGSLSASSPDAKDKYKKHKQLLSDALKGYFSMDTDPFKTYGKTDGYTLKINLSYPQEEAGQVETKTVSDEVEDIFSEYTEER